MRLLICGGRDFDDAAFAARILDAVHRKHVVKLVIHGAARGADTLGGRWAQYNGIEVEKYPAQWGAHGKAAGPLRNAQMLESGRPDAVVAFPGGSGTADMVRRAKAAGVPVWQPGK